jgi:methionyl-tRNA formyltransferase
VCSFREEPWEPPFMDDLRAEAVAAGATFVETRRVGGQRWQRVVGATPPELMLAVHWRYLVPPAAAAAARGMYVFHDSLLPAYRGFAPTLWAIANGEPETGVTLFRAAAEVDAGDIVGQQAVPIGPDDTIATLFERVTEAYLRVLERHLPAIAAGSAVARPQDHARATYTCRWVPEDGLIDWSAPTKSVHDLIRAVTAPYPGAFTFLGGRRLRVWSARRPAEARRYVGRVPGRVIEVRRGEGSVVLTGDGALMLTRVQLDGDEPRCAAEVLDSLSHTLGR